MKYYRKSELSYTPMKPERERELFRRYYAGDISARDEIITNQLKLAVRLALQISHGNIPEDEAISAANAGLMRAISGKTFDPERGLRFSSYAQAFICGEVIRTFRRLSRLVGKAFDDQEIAESMVPETEVALEKFGTVDAEVESEDLNSMRGDYVEKAIDLLTPRGQEVVRMVYFDRLNLAEVARKLGISREAARRVHERALERLRRELQNSTVEELT
jgi:RNA polymerase sporulation-specific sigma factor